MDQGGKEWMKELKHMENNTDFQVLETKDPIVLNSFLSIRCSETSIC